MIASDSRNSVRQPNLEVRVGMVTHRVAREGHWDRDLQSGILRYSLETCFRNL